MNINPFSQHFILVAPLINLLLFTYHYIPDIGVVIILLTLFIRLLLAPSFHKSLKSQAAMTALQPKLNELREKHKNDQAAQSQAIMALYKENNVSPFSSCLPMLLQLPILISLYHVFTKALNGQYGDLYSFVPRPENFDPTFLGFLNLAQHSSASVAGIILAVLAGLAQFVQSKMMMPKTQSNDTTTKIMGWQTVYFLPLFSIYISLRLPAGLPLYWLVTTLFAIGQQYYIMKKHPELARK